MLILDTPLFVSFRAPPSLPGHAGRAAAADESDLSSPPLSPMQVSSPDAHHGLPELSDHASPTSHWSPLASSGDCQQQSGRPSPHSQAALDVPAADLVPEMQETASSRPVTAPAPPPDAPQQRSPSPLPEARAGPPQQCPGQPAAPLDPAGWSPAAGHRSQPRSPAAAPAQPPGWLPAAAHSPHAVLRPDPSPQSHSPMATASVAHRPCSDVLPSPVASPGQPPPRCSPAGHADAADVPMDDGMPSLSAAASQQRGTAPGEGLAGAAGQPAVAQLAACQPAADGVLPTAAAVPAVHQGVPAPAQDARPGGPDESSAGALPQDLGLAADGKLTAKVAVSLLSGAPRAPNQSPKQVGRHAQASLLSEPDLCSSPGCAVSAGLGYLQHLLLHAYWISGLYPQKQGR